MKFSELSWSAKYALTGAFLVPLFGRLALAGTGYEHELYRYVIPLLVGSVAGFMIGHFKDEMLKNNDRLRLESRRSEQLMQELKVNADYLRGILDYAPMPIYLKETGGLTYLLVNRMGAEVAGISPEKVIGRNDFELLPREMAEMFRKQDELVLSSAAPQTFLTAFVIEGKKNYFLTNKFPLHDENGEIYAIGGVCMDITERKQAEELLAQEEERLSVTLRNIGDGVISTDTEGRVVLVNAVAEKLTGWKQEEAQGRLLEEVMPIVSASDEKPIPSPVKAIIERDMIMNLPKEVVLVSRDGKRRFIEDSCAPIHDRESRIIGVVVVFRDVTRDRQLEKELLKIRRLESLGVLAGGIAHDFNNIMLAIMGNINLAELAVGKEHEAAELLRNAEIAAKKACDLTGQLLTFSKGGSPVKKSAHLPVLVRETVELLKHGSNVAISLDLPEGIWSVDIDTGQMGQVIQNLIINAQQAMPDGGIIEISCDNMTIEEPGHLCSALPSGRYVRLIVRDHGIGIPENLIERIFDPYFTTKQQGSGLGLAIVHSIVSKHGGHICVDSEPGKGTVFTIILPAGTKDTVAQEDKKAETLPHSGGGTVLVVDDDEMVRDIASQMLAYCGYSAITAHDGEEALAIYRRSMEEGRQIAAVIMDLTIPGGMGGKECAAKLLSEFPDAVCIVSSGYSNDDVMANFSKYGFRAALAKPFDVEEMRSTLRQVLKT